MSSGVDHGREPCPDRILDDVGGAFSMGAVGGSAWHFIKGAKNSPRGERLLGASQAVRMNAPRLGGSFAVWGGLFSAFDCSFVYVRQKEDPWNSIAAGAATGGFLQLRQGLGAAGRSALFGGVLLAMIEGAGIMLNRLTASMAQPPPPDMLPGPPGGAPAGFPVPAGIGAGGGGMGGGGVGATETYASVRPPTLGSSDQVPETLGGAPAAQGQAPGGGSWLGRLMGGGAPQEDPALATAAPVKLGQNEPGADSFAQPPAVPDFAFRPPEPAKRAEKKGWLG